MVFGVPHRLNQLVDDMVWRWLIWIAHAEIDNVFATAARF